MGRLRRIDPDVLHHPVITQMSPTGRLLWIGMILVADPETGTIPADERWLRHRCLPNTSGMSATCRRFVDHLKAFRLIYDDILDGVKVYRITNYHLYQQKRAPSKLPYLPSSSSSSSSKVVENSSRPSRKALGLESSSSTRTLDDEEDSRPSDNILGLESFSSSEEARASNKTETAKRAKPPKPLIDWEAQRATWNALAQKHDLPPIGRFSPTRKKTLGALLGEEPDLWGKVEAELPKRGAWAKEHRFPAFDQILTPRLRQKFLEGTYRDGRPQSAVSRRQSASNPTNKFDEVDY